MGGPKVTEEVLKKILRKDDSIRYEKIKPIVGMSIDEVKKWLKDHPEIASTIGVFIVGYLKGKSTGIEKGERIGKRKGIEEAEDLLDI